MSCAEGDTGFVYDGLLDFTVEETELDAMPDIPVKIMMNVGTPDQAFAFSRLPNAGVGLARLEFIINRQIGIHPKALLDLDTLTGRSARPDRRGGRRVRQPARLLRHSGSPRACRRIAAAFAPEPGDRADVATSSPTSTPTSIGGELYEPHEENPMIGYRGAVALPVAGLRRLLRDGVRGAAATSATRWA